MEELKIDDVRPEVKNFAIAMEKRLRKNDFKGGWNKENLAYFVIKIFEHSRQLRNDILYNDLYFSKIDCINISNYCMILYDNIEKY
mgnify:FL=1